MPQNNVRHLWRETLSSRPVSKDTYRGMHLAVLRRAVHQKPAEHVFAILFEVGDFVLCESKGHPPSATPFELPSKESETLWLCFQFQGTATFSSGTSSEPGTLFSFISTGGDRLLTFQAGKQWALYLGVSGASREQLLAELPLLRERHGQQPILQGVPISHPDRQTLESLPKLSFGPFSTVHHIGQLIIKTYGNYAQQLKRCLQQPQGQPQIQLYNQAIAYIRDNYMDEALSREKIAEALHCSARSLSRAFEGRPASLNASILILRLYKSRELLRNEPGCSVEQIALMLHFFDASHFTAQYKKYFHRTPREERKVIGSRK
ncbi:AraC family transcriptional regulator [Parapedobacter tibetensis]|uniref:AraC family transcriptional regulator n=1 Tax=Parapedobacter tibetensis TaxID=2972951 RepID=UPI00214DC5FF|nr:AraC family transcriptional regulator [Parapedobacter tibetensis]